MLFCGWSLLGGIPSVLQSASSQLRLKTSRSSRAHRAMTILGEQPLLDRRFVDGEHRFVDGEDQAERMDTQQHSGLASKKNVLSGSPAVVSERDRAPDGK